MARYYGEIGYAETVETAPGVYDASCIVKRMYYGDVVRNTRRWDRGESANDDLNVSNTISIVADAYAMNHFFAIRYISWMGARWKVTGVEVQPPRLLLTIGGVYNGPED